ncbi:hypothetical protein EII31_00575 [Leucobacter sp. OH2974_COT-288]|uniref:Ferritin-like domain-containing protein n=1 Tax=Canibacter oris TaxID=1365628 RepID=A0A840DL82_9MICO|nr:ferritin-like fold-containing protein [Canibacter oris]MBB4070737.1 hypothetical protein [Canibacter oris]RRD36127.1 hypothetical protein EII31_00575 [Leucobacter sp. OH2974_COT-288]
MFSWLSRFKKPTASVAEMLGKADEKVIRVEVKEFAPGIVPFLSLNALTELYLYEAATQAVLGAESLAAKSALADIAGASLAKHKRFAAELKRRGHQVDIEMNHYMPRFAQYTDRIQVDDWHQHVLTVLLVGGMLEDFMASLASGLKDSFRKEAAEILSDHSSQQDLHVLLAAEIMADPRVADKLALWGRRLVGDTLLLAQDILKLSENRQFVWEEMEPIFTEITSDHMRRMDSLGLTA